MTIELPVDERATRKKQHDPVDGDSFVLATDRIRAFHDLYPDGRIITTVERDVYGDAVVFTVAAHVYKTSESDKPDAMAHATRDTRDEDDGVARRPQETAETVAISRALRNLGVMVTATSEPSGIDWHSVSSTWTPETDIEIGERVQRARIEKGWSQAALGKPMREFGFRWSQATVWSVEQGERPLRLSEARALHDLIGFLP